MVLVTGATGFVGRQVVRVLRAHGRPVRALVHTSVRASVLAQTGATSAPGSVLDLPSLRAAARGAEAVVHLVAIIRERPRRGLTFQAVNYQGTRNVVQAARESGVRRLVHMSALGAQDNLRYPYLRSKWQGERAVMEGGIPYTILRPSILFGEGDEFLNSLAAVARALPVVPVIGSGRTRFQPISVEDVAECVARALDSPALEGQIVEFGGPHHLTYDDLMDIVVRTLRVRRAKLHVPVGAMRPAIAVMSALLPRPPITGHELDMVAVDNVAELDSTRRHFDLEPRPVEGNIDYVRRLTLADSWKILLGRMSPHVRDH
ncbi:MAG: complex I NDUFA9 subunit family protein [Chloroflexi bacterium]|nr:complex I NDUFA9 subunit family protein [Chloroflexota bacterium]